MSLKTLPFLLINLGGEMVYILDQRLKAQNIPKDKARKVLHDIVGTMFNKRFIEEMFKPQEIYNRKAIRTVFDRLAHASIMRLNSASMDKLYDLMTMAVKHQVTFSMRASDILLVTLNHVDSIVKLVEDNPTVKAQVEHSYILLATHYANMNAGQFLLIRQTLLNFFQDVHIRVSVFLKEKTQNENGRFILPTGGQLPFGTAVPGTIKVFDGKGKVATTSNFKTEFDYIQSTKTGSIEMKGDRCTNLGFNMYSKSSSNLESAVQSNNKTTNFTSSDIENLAPNPLAQAQLDLLSKLIGSSSQTQKTSKNAFKLNLFETEREEEQAAAVRTSTDNSTVVNFDQSKRGRAKELDKIMGEMNVADESGGGSYDLLDLMDK